jgi:polysaccharide biosynthesis/export protein
MDYSGANTDVHGSTFPRMALPAILAMLLIFVSGCSGPGGSFTLLPAGDFLLQSTKELRHPIAAQAPVPRELEKSVLPAYIVQPGDVVLVEPVALDSTLRFPADQTVLPDGSIDLGRYGRLLVAGKTLEQIEEDVRGAVAALEKTPSEINVRLVNAQSAVYYVLGEVNSAGSFPLVGNETVLDAILIAGGLTDRASPCNIILARPSGPHSCRTVIPICYRHITQQGDTATNYQIMPGDRVYVASRSFMEQIVGCYSRRDCPHCRGQQCACPGSCGAGSPRTPSYSLPVQAALPEQIESLPEPAAATARSTSKTRSASVARSAASVSAGANGTAASIEKADHPIPDRDTVDPFLDPFGDD